MTDAAQLAAWCEQLEVNRLKALRRPTGAAVDWRLFRPMPAADSAMVRIEETRPAHVRAVREAFADVVAAAKENPVSDLRLVDAVSILRRRLRNVIQDTVSATPKKKPKKYAWNAEIEAAARAWIAACKKGVTQSRKEFVENWLAENGGLNGPKPSTVNKALGLHWEKWDPGRRFSGKRRR